MSVVAQREARRIVAFQKCGHTSVINMFMTPPGKSVERGSVPAVKISNVKVPEVYKGASEETSHWPEAKITIAVFRDPLARAASAYQHFIVRTLSTTIISEFNGLPLMPIPSLGRKQFTELGFEAGMTFPEFIQHLCKIDLNYDKHLKPQSVSLAEAASGLVYGIQLEQLNERWPAVVKAFDLPCTTEVADFNAANYTYDSDHWSVPLVRELYADDYALWEKAYVETRETIPPIDNQVL